MFTCPDCGLLNVKTKGRRCLSCARRKDWADGKMNKFTPETRARQSAAAKKRGYHEECRSPEARAKISAGVKRALSDPEVRERVLGASLMVRNTPECRAKIGAKIKASWADGRQLEKHHAARARGCYDKSMSNRPYQPSGLEIMLAHAMDRADIRYEQQFRPDGYWRYYDFYVPDQALMIEVDGSHWHSAPDAKYVDKEKDLAAVRLGYDILRVSEADLEAYGPDYIIEHWIFRLNI